MSIKLNDTQLVLLSAASQRDDHCLVRPAGPKRAQAQRAVAKLLEAGLLKEIRAKAGAPIWRRDDESGQTYALKLTAAGAKALFGRTTPWGGGLSARLAWFGHDVLFAVQPALRLLPELGDFLARRGPRGER